MKSKENMRGLPPDIGALMNRLILLEEIYKEAAGKADEGVMKEQFTRLANEKELFLRDFTNLMHFTVPQYREKFGERISMEKEPVKIEFDEVLLNDDEHEILRYCVDLERDLVDQYDVLTRLIDGDEFATMVVKMQSDETKRSVRELEAVSNRAK